MRLVQDENKHTPVSNFKSYLYSKYSRDKNAITHFIYRVYSKLLFLRAHILHLNTFNKLENYIQRGKEINISSNL